MSVKKGNKTVGNANNIQNIRLATQDEIDNKNHYKCAITPKGFDDIVGTEAETLEQTIESKTNKGQKNGYAPLNANSKIPMSNLSSSNTNFAINNGKSNLLSAQGFGGSSESTPISFDDLNTFGTYTGTGFKDIAVNPSTPTWLFEEDYTVHVNTVTWWTRGYVEGAHYASNFILEIKQNGAWVSKGSYGGGQFGGNSSGTITINEDCQGIRAYSTGAVYASTQWGVTGLDGVKTNTITSSADTLSFNVDEVNKLTFTNISENTRTVTSLSDIDVSSSFNEIGELNIDNGVVSGFSKDNYVSLKEPFSPESNTWEIVNKFKTNASMSVGQIIFHLLTGSNDYNVALWITTAGKLSMHGSSNGTSWDLFTDILSTTVLQPSTVYYSKIEFTGTAYNMYLSTDGETWNLENTVASSTPIFSGKGLRFGSYTDGRPINQIDLKSSYIKINSIVWWSYIYNTERGTYKVVLPNSGNQPYLVKNRIYNTDDIEGKDFANYYKLGSPLINDGVVSGFSNVNYVKTNSTFNFSTADTWEIITKHNFTSVGSINDGFMGVLGGAYNLNYYVSSGNLVCMELSSNGTSYDIAGGTTLSTNSAITLNIDFYIKTEFTGTAYNLYYGTDLDNMTLQKTVSSSIRVCSRSNNFAFGVDESGSHSSWAGSIDLKECTIKMNGTLVWKGYGNIIDAGDFWINQQTPNTIKRYNGTSWVTFDDTILMDSSISVKSGIITDLIQPTYNDSHVATGVQLASSFTLPSTKEYHLNLLASGSTYVAPANGWFYLYKEQTSNFQYTRMTNKNNGIVINSFHTCSIKVRRDDIVQVDYNNGGTTYVFAFIFANGCSDPD